MGNNQRLCFSRKNYSFCYPFVHNCCLHYLLLIQMVIQEIHLCSIQVLVQDESNSFLTLFYSQTVCVIFHTSLLVNNEIRTLQYISADLLSRVPSIISMLKPLQGICRAC